MERWSYTTTIYAPGRGSTSSIPWLPVCILGYPTQMNTENVEAYLRDGCGRCEHYQTPSCKVHRWTDVLVAVRALLLDTELDETLKWGAPCYTLGGKNVVMLSALVDHATLSFFKGSALDDPQGLLEKPGPNTRVGRVVRVSTVEQVRAHEANLRALVESAIQVERSGVSVVAEPGALEVPDALQDLLEARPDVAAAFQALTPGRQRSHVLHVSGAKQEKTRVRRADRCAEKILSGKGWNER